MKWCHSATLALTFVLAMAGPPLVAEGESWTLEAAIREARAANPDGRMAAERRVQAAALLAEAQGAALPQVRITGGYSQTNEPMRAFGSILNTATFTPGLDFNNPGTIDHLQIGAMVSQPLYTGGALLASREAADAGRRAAEHREAAVLEQLSLSVVQTYYGILQAREMTRALEAEARNLEEALRVAQARFERGQLLESELLNIEVQRAHIEEQILAASHREVLTGKSLLVLMGRSPTGTLRLQEDPVLDEPPPPAPSTVGNERHELQAMREQLSAADHAIAIAASGHQPQVEAFAGIQHDRGWKRSGNGSHWMAGLRMEWAVFDGRQTASQTQRARAEAREAQEAYRQLELETQMQEEQARLNRELAQRQFEVADRSVEQASKSASISRARFESGDLLTTELIGAESRLSQARIQRSMAAYRIRIANAELRWALGLEIRP